MFWPATANACASKRAVLGSFADELKESEASACFAANAKHSAMEVLPDDAYSQT